MQPTERLNKVLAHLGFGSRRHCDALIAAGKVTINGQPAKLGQPISPSDKIAVDNTPVSQGKQETILLAFHKPAGVTTTKQDPHAKITLTHFLPPQYQTLFPVGRLDRVSRGLLLLTNNGDLAYKLTHPKFEHEKEYWVQVVANRVLTRDQFRKDLHRLETEIVNKEVQTKPIRILNWSVSQEQGHTIGVVTVVLQEGKKRQIRYMFQSLGYTVIDLLRTRVASVLLENLKPGQYRKIEAKELKT